MFAEDTRSLRDYNIEELNGYNRNFLFGFAHDAVFHALSMRRDQVYQEAVRERHLQRQKQVFTWPVDDEEDEG